MKKIVCSVLVGIMLISSLSAFAMTTSQFDRGMAKGISYFNRGMYYEARDEFQWFCDYNWGAMNYGQQQYALDYLDGTKAKIQQLENTNRNAYSHETGWEELEISFEDYVGVWDTYSSRYALYADARIRIVDVDLRNKTIYIDYKVDRDSATHLTMDNKLTIDDYPYERVVLNYYNKTLSNGKAAIVTDCFDLLDGDTVTLILDEDRTLGLGNRLGNSIIRLF